MEKLEDRKIIYTIKDKHYSDFDVYFSHNAWWLERAKVEALIQAFKIDATIEEACTYAGISIDQYKYFVELHPDFSAVRTACKELPILKARQSVVGALDQPEMALKYLERKRKDEFSTRSETDITSGGEKLEGLAVSFVDNKKDKYV